MAYDYSTHEALHTASIVEDMIDVQLLQHPAILENLQWWTLADEAHKKIFDLYQAIGATMPIGDKVEG